MAHAAAVPEKDDVLCVALAGDGVGEQATDRHSEHGCAEELEHAAAGELVVGAGVHKKIIKALWFNTCHVAIKFLVFRPSLISCLKT